MILGDLLAQRVDAIVNPANEHLLHGGGVARLIASRAGAVWDAASRRLAPLAAGTAALDGAGHLGVPYVIHVVGPRWQGGGAGEADLLAAAHRAVVRVAADAGITSVAMPAVSTGIFGYPPALAAPVAAEALAGALAAAPAVSVRICVIDADLATLYAAALAAA